MTEAFGLQLFGIFEMVIATNDLQLSAIMHVCLFIPQKLVEY